MKGWPFWKKRPDETSLIAAVKSKNRVNHPLTQRLVSIGAPINADTKDNLIAAVGSGFFVKTCLRQTRNEKDDLLIGIFVLITHNHFCRVLDSAFEVTSGIAFMHAFETANVSEVMPPAIEAYNIGSRQNSSMITGLGNMIAHWAQSGDPETIADIAEAYDYIVANGRR